MLRQFKIQCVLVSVLILCLCVTLRAEELDPIAAQDIYVTSSSIIIPIEKMRPSEKVTNEGILKAMKNIELSKLGRLPKREPLSVAERGDGTYTIIDGNKTFAALKELGAKNLPAIVSPCIYHKDVKTIEDLYALTSAAENEFNNLMDALQKEYGGELMKRAGIKDETRIREKAELELGGDYSRMVDILAASLIYPDEQSLLSAFEAIQKRDDVIFLKDRWHNPLPNGYKDCYVNIILPNGAICELQLHHQAILQVRDGFDQDIYEFRRANFKNPAMKHCIERAIDLQKVVYASVWDGRFAEVDEAAKKLMEDTAKQLAKEKSPEKAEILIEKLENILREILPEELEEAA